MRLLTSLCAVLLATTVFAQAPVIGSVSPEKIIVDSGEHFITVRGSNFWTSPRALVTISGPAGTSTLEANTLSSSWLEVWVRSDIIATLGRYTVVVTNPDGAKSAPAFFEVVNSPAPLLYLPPTLFVKAEGPEGAHVKFTAQGTTADGKPATITCSHESGALFPLGNTNVTCTASDPSRGTSTTRTMTVTVADTTPPVLTVPDDFTVEATGPDGAVVKYEASAVDNVDGPVPANCYAPSGTTFAIGTTTVHCFAYDSSSNEAKDEFKITVADNLRPVLTLPADIAVETKRDDGEIVTFTATAKDHNGNSLPVTCLPESGSLFGFGTTVVACWAIDSDDRMSGGTFNVTVTKAAPPPPPVLTLPDDIMVKATSDDGAKVTYEASAKDSEGTSLTIYCAPPSGSKFPIGTTTVYCEATDHFKQTTKGTFTVTVEKQAPPPPVTLHLPDDISVEAMSSSGTVVEYEATAEENGHAVDVVCAPASGSTFPVGTTKVNCSATGSGGGTAKGSFLVHVLDSDAPVIHSVSATPDVLWPPNGKLTDVTIHATAEDAIDPNVEVRIIEVTANEAIDEDDWEVTGALTLQLRAARNGSSQPRVYSIVIRAMDDSGNVAKATVTVRVPHDGADASTPARKGKRRAVGK